MIQYFENYRRTLFFLCIACLVMFTVKNNYKTIIYNNVNESNKSKSINHYKTEKEQKYTTTIDSSHDQTIIVTAFIDLGHFDKASVVRTTSDYLRWMKSYSFIENHVIAYFDSLHFMQEFKKVRGDKKTEYVLLNRSEIEPFKYEKAIQTIFNNPNYPKNSPKSTDAKYVSAMNSKFYFLKDAIIRHGLNNQFIQWLDIGYFRTLNTTNIQPFYLEIPNCFRHDTILATQVYEMLNYRVVDIMRNGHDWVAGGCLLGMASRMLMFCEDYQEYFEYLLDRNLSNHDQSIIYSLYSERNHFKRPRIPLQVFQQSESTLNIDHWYGLGFLMRRTYMERINGNIFNNRCDRICS